METVANNLKVYIRRGIVFPFGMLISMHILHSYWPILFDFLVCSSPVFICTALLLGALLVYGEPNIHENREASGENRTKMKKFSKGKQAEGTVQAREAGGFNVTNISRLKHPFDSSLGSSCRPLDDHHCSSGSENDEAENSSPYASVDDIIPMLDEVRPKLDSEARHSAHLLVDNSDAASNNTTQDSESDYDSVEEVKKQEDEAIIPMLDELRPILNSDVPRFAHLPIDNSDAVLNSTTQNNESNYGSIEGEVKKQEDEDIIPTLDELCPSLDSEAPQPAHLSVGNSDAASSNTSQDSEMDYDSVEEQTEKQEDEEAQEEKEVTNEAVVSWTEDDQKNLMDLVSSELERNQRLENLIANGIARNFQSFHAEKNMMDLDSNDHMPNLEDLSHLHYQIPSISAPQIPSINALRCNPFDLPFEMEETIGLPPFPGSAPVLQPRCNPFELPSDQDEESDSLARETVNYQKFAPAPQREMSYQKHESFTLGSSFSWDCKEDSLDSMLKPNSVHQFNSSSPFIDQDNHKDRLEEFNLENHVISPENHVEPDKQASQSTNVVDSVDEHEDVDDDHAIQLNSSTVTEENHRAADAFGAVQMENRQGESHSSDSQAGNLEAIEERYYDSSSYFSEASEKSSGSMLSVPADSDIANATERLVDSQHVDPFYDSLPHAGKKFSSSNLVESDVQLGGSSELGSPCALHNKVLSEKSGLSSVSTSMDENLSSYTTTLWVAPPSFASVDEIKSRLRELTESEQGVICVGLSVIDEDFAHPISPVLPKIKSPSHLSVDSSKDLADEVGMMTNIAASSNPSALALPYTVQEMPLFQQSEEADLKDSDVTSDMSPISTNISEDFIIVKELEHIGKTKKMKELMPVVQSSKKDGLKESDAVTSYVSPLLMNNREDFRGREKHESMMDPSANPFTFGDQQQFDEHEVGLSGEGDNLLPKSSSSLGKGKIKNIKKLMPVFHQFGKGGRLKDSDVVTSDVSTIPTNSLEVFRVRKESESEIDPSANASRLSGLQQLEERDLALSGQGDKLVSMSSSSLNRKIMNIKRLMPVFHQSDKARLKDFDVPEDLRVAKENEAIIVPIANSSGLSGLQQIEERKVGVSGDGDKIVSKSSSSFTIGKINKNVKKLMPVFKLSEKAGHKVSDVATPYTSLIPTNYSSEDVTVGKENDPPANSSRLSGLQQTEGDKSQADLSKSNSSFKIGKVKHIKKFW